MTERDIWAVVNLNLGLAYLWAKRWTAPTGYDLGDLAQWAIFGLYQAVERYEPDHPKGAKFSTYAGYYLKLWIDRSIEYGCRSVRIPAYVVLLRRKLYKLDPNQKMSIAELALEFGKTELVIRATRQAPVNVLRIDAPGTRASDNGSLSETVSNPSDITPEHHAERDSIRRLIRARISCLPKREAEVIRLRFGIGQEEEESLAEIGVRYGVTRERVRQIEKKALGRLRMYMITDRLKGAV